MDTVQAPQRIFMLLPANSLQLHLCKHDAANNWGHLLGMGTRFSVAEKVTWLNQNARPNQLMGCQNIKKHFSIVVMDKLSANSEFCIFYKKVIIPRNPHFHPKHDIRWRWGPFFSGFGRCQGNVPFKGHPRGWELEWAHCQAWLRKWGAELGVSCCKVMYMGDSPSNKLNHQDLAIFLFIAIC